MVMLRNRKGTYENYKMGITTVNKHKMTTKRHEKPKKTQNLKRMQNDYKEMQNYINDNTNKKMESHHDVCVSCSCV